MRSDKQPSKKMANGYESTEEEIGHLIEENMLNVISNQGNAN